MIFDTHRGHAWWWTATSISCLGLVLFSAVTAQADEVPIAIAQRNKVEKQLQELRAVREDMARTTAEFDKRIGALEIQLGTTIAAVAPSGATVAANGGVGAASTAVEETPSRTAVERNVIVSVLKTPPPDVWGTYQPGRGIIVANGSFGTLAFSGNGYLRYLNQTAINSSYTDSFGRAIAIAPRNDLQLAKVQIIMNGWLLNPKFNYSLYFWTANANQGKGAQVVGAGYISYLFSDAFQLYGGVQSLPSTRSTNRIFPNFLRNDNRTIADEFFRASYTTGIWAQGRIARGLDYRVMIANNLSALGVSAGQLDAKIDTIGAALTWMPTTAEYGPGSGFGDFENHQKAATLFGIHYTHSTETAQGQPFTDGFENTQLRLSDGTLLFKPGAFNTDGRITQARYQMLAANGGVKYHGFSFDVEYYARWLDKFITVGYVPVTNLFDEGLQVQASTMLIDKRLQLYFSGSKIFGQYGNPSDAGIGLNWFPFKAKTFRVAPIVLYVDKSPVGNALLPYQVGSKGVIFQTDFALVF